MYIIDGYNLMFHESWYAVGHHLEDQREHLLCYLRKFYKQVRTRRIIVVFDGRAWSGPYNETIRQQGIEVIFSTLPGKADEKIIRLSSKHHKCKVITADRRLADKVKKNHGIIISPEQFLRDCRRKITDNSKKKQETKQPVQSSDEIDYWLKEFDLKEEVEIPPTGKPASIKKIDQKKKKWRS